MQAKADGKLKEIGVSNYSASKLRDLMKKLEELEKSGILPLPLHEAKPDVCQNELHPFLCTAAPDVCDEFGIRFEAHSIFTLLEEYPRTESSTPAQLAVAYALHVGRGSVVFGSANYQHVKENLRANADEFNATQLLKLLDFPIRHARYPGSDTVRFVPEVASAALFLELSMDYLVEVLAPQLRKDSKQLDNGGLPSKIAKGIPRLDKRSWGKFAELAHAFFVTDDGTKIVFKDDLVKDEHSKVNRLGVLVKRIRKRLDDHTLLMKQKTRPALCKARAIENPEALPVDIPDAATLQPFIDFVADMKKLPEIAIRMERGTLFPDGRLDFCKQVSQPSFPQLCDAVLEGGAVKHFLLGNNLALRNDHGGRNEAALVNLIAQSKDIETFYLAGNDIDEHQIQAVAEAFGKSKDVRYVWLKMNPIRCGGSYHLGKMLRVNPLIELLDLFNTGQSNEGAASLLHGYLEMDCGATSGLQHLYLDINAISDGDLVGKVAACFPSLKTLSLNVNQLGDTGITDFYEYLLHCDRELSVERLNIGSIGCTDDALPTLTALVRRLPHLTKVELGSYKSTKFFRQKPNCFSSFNAMLQLATALADNSKERGTSAYFGFQNAYVQQDATELVQAMAALGLHVTGNQNKGNGYSTLTRANTEKKLLQPAPVEKIQSVYRNVM